MQQTTKNISKLLDGIVYKLICGQNNGIQIFNDININVLDYQTEPTMIESILYETNDQETTYKFAINEKIAVCNITLLNAEPIKSLKIDYGANTLIKVDKVIHLRQINSIQNLSDILCIGKNHPMIFDGLLDFDIYITFKGKAFTHPPSLHIICSKNLSRLKFKQDLYPYYNCKTQEEKNLMLVKKLNELTQSVNSGSKIELEMIKLTNTHLNIYRNPLYYDPKARCMYPYLNYTCFDSKKSQSITNGIPNILGFYIFGEQTDGTISDVFTYTDNIKFNIENFDCEFNSQNTIPIGNSGIRFLSFIPNKNNVLTNPMSIEQWFNLINVDKNSIPNNVDIYMHNPIVKDLLECTITIITVSMNLRVYENQSIKMLYVF